MVKRVVFISVSKIQFESKSQPVPKLCYFITWCLSVCQRYNLKANHNKSTNPLYFTPGVYQCVKDTIWKQITTLTFLRGFRLLVFISVSKIQFESKSQPVNNWVEADDWCLSVCQRYNLKANHNMVLILLHF